MAAETLNWWSRNAAQIEALSAVASVLVAIVLVIVTARYVRFTRELVRDADRQVEHLGQELELLKKQVDVATDVARTDKQLADRAHAHAEAALAEATRSRLSDNTPVVLVLPHGGIARLSRSDGTGVGSIPIEEFDRSQLTLSLSLEAINFGPGPVVLEQRGAGEGRTSVVKEEILSPAELAPAVLHARSVVTWSIERTGRELRDRYFGYPLPLLVVRTYSPLTRVFDVHSFQAGALAGPREDGEIIVGNDDLRLDYIPPHATTARYFPGDAGWTDGGTV